MAIANCLVGNGSDVCVNFLHFVTSVYLRECTICREGGFLLLIKSGKKLMERLIEYINSLHAFEVHEIISLDIDVGSETYLKWISESTGVR